MQACPLPINSGCIIRLQVGFICHSYIPTVIYGQQQVHYGDVMQHQNGPGVMFAGGAQHSPDRTQSYGSCQQGAVWGHAVGRLA